MIMNLSGGGNPKNVLVVSVGEASATITVTDGATTLTKASDASGYAYFKNLDEGTWTVSAVNSSSHTAPLTPTVTITSTQTAYYVRLGFEFWLYDNSYADASLNECTGNSGGWDGAVGNRTADYITTRMTGGGYVYATNSFDMSKYDIVSVLAYVSNGLPSSKVQVRASNKTTILAEAEIVPNSLQWLTIDVSAITAQAYVYIAASGGDVAVLCKCYLA
jgi:hypothetical protein